MQADIVAQVTIARLEWDLVSFTGKSGGKVVPRVPPPPKGKGNADRSGKVDGTKNGPLSHQERDRNGKGARLKWLGDPLTTSVAFLVRSEEG